MTQQKILSEQFLDGVSIYAFTPPYQTVKKNVYVCSARTEYTTLCKQYVNLSVVTHVHMVHPILLTVFSSLENAGHW